MGAFVKKEGNKGRFFKTLDSAKEKTKYVCFREREGENEKLGVFSKDTDNANIYKFMQSLDNRLTKHPTKEKMIELVFSMSGDEWKRSGFEYGDYKTLIRDSMEKFEMKTGKRLTWISAEHFKKSNPHAHVMISGVYKDRDGVERKLDFYTWDKVEKGQLSPELRQMKECFQESKNELRGFEVEIPYKENYHEKQRFSPGKQTAKDLSKTVGKPLLNSILQRIRESKRLEERERQNDYDYRS